MKGEQEKIRIWDVREEGRATKFGGKDLSICGLFLATDLDQVERKKLSESTRYFDVCVWFSFLGILFIFHMVFLVVKCFCVFRVIKELLQGSMHVEKHLLYINNNIYVWDSYQVIFLSFYVMIFSYYFLLNDYY